MVVIGLCGGSGSGKGTVCELFAELGIPSIDTDAVYHSLTSHPSECLLELRERFGERIVKDGALDRSVLSDLVFKDASSEKNRQDLNSIAHKHIKIQTCKIIEEQKQRGAKGVIIDAPLLFESSFDKLCDLCVAVVCKTDLRIERIMKRDGISEETAKRRIAAQISDDELLKLCSFSLRNESDRADLKEQVNSLYNKIFE